MRVAAKLAQPYGEMLAMLNEVSAAATALDGFVAFISTNWTDQPYNVALGNAWNVPGLSRQDLALRTRRISERLKALPDAKVDANFRQQISSVPAQIQFLQNNTIPQLQGGNAPIVLLNYELVISNLESAIPIDDLPNWEEVAKSEKIPTELGRKLRLIDASISRLEPRAEHLDRQIEAIRNAHSAALDLPTDLESLREARDEIKQFSADAKAALAAVKDASEKVETARDRIEEQEVAATKLIGSIGKAYSAATSAGLGRAFTERANALNGSTWVWVGMLVAALMSGGYIGFLRLEALQKMLTQPLAKPEYVWLNATMTLFAIAGPVWFAWIATRQIAQRFRLAEDYGFKASVARAYEGYRMEAARVDPEFEARLFASALDRLEEAPLRFLSVEEHGSPYEALLASAGFQKALDRFPDFRSTFLAMAERVASVTKPDPAPTPLKNIPDQAEK